MTDTILPEDPTAAIQKLIDITAALNEKMEAESNALAMNDAVQYSVAEQGKDEAATIYHKAAEEFGARADELRGKVDTALIDELEAAQRTLAETAQKNVEMLKKVPGLKTDD